VSKHRKRQRKAFGLIGNIALSGELAPKTVGAKGNPMQVPSFLSSYLEGDSPRRFIQGMVFGAIVAIVVGFNWGGWMLGSTANGMVKQSSQAALVQALAPICADRFRHAADASANLAALKKVNSWQQDTFIERGGWATFPGMTSPDRGVAQACADLLASAAKQ